MVQMAGISFRGSSSCLVLGRGCVPGVVGACFLSSARPAAPLPPPLPRPATGAAAAAAGRCPFAESAARSAAWPAVGLLAAVGVAPGSGLPTFAFQCLSSSLQHFGTSCSGRDT